MKTAIVFLCLVAAAACEHCFADAKDACNARKDDLVNCNAKYGKATNYIGRLNQYLNMHITRSFQYLLMSNHFGSYEMEREGFKKLYRKLSDSTWEDAVDIIKYVTMRGEKVTLEPHYDDIEKDQSTIFQDAPIEMSEMVSLAQAVDIQKKLAEEAHNIYEEANPHDPEMGAFVENEFMHKHAKTIRELVGYTNDIKRLITVGPEEPPKSVGIEVFLLDEYLNKKL